MVQKSKFNLVLFCYSVDSDIGFGIGIKKKNSSRFDSFIFIPRNWRQSVEPIQMWKESNVIEDIIIGSHDYGVRNTVKRSNFDQLRWSSLDFGYFRAQKEDLKDKLWLIQQ